MKQCPAFALTRVFRASLLIPSLVAIGHFQHAYAIDYIWDGGAGTAALGGVANWNPDGTPASGDTLIWDGSAASILSLTTGAFGGSSSGVGVTLRIDSGQTLTIDSTGGIFRLKDITVNSGAGAFTLGNGSGSFQFVLYGSSNTTHVFTNNSVNTATISSEAFIQNTGNSNEHVNFTGTGNWRVEGTIIQSGTTATSNLTKQGTGTTTLTGVNTYTGSTTVTQGALVIGGSGSINTSSGVTVNGGTFRYNSTTNLTTGLTFTSGTVGGSNLSGVNLSVGANQTLAPANSTGAMSAGDVTFATGGTFEFEINDAAGTAGSTTAGWDLLNPTSLNITADAGQFNLSIISLTDLQASGLAQNFNSAGSYAWLFVDADSIISTFNADRFNIETTGFLNSFAGTFGIGRGDVLGLGDNTQLYITYTGSIPEPSTYATLTGVFLAAFVVVRRRRR